MIKKAPFTKDEYYWLQPSDSYRTEVRLDDYYNLSIPGEYRVYYQAFNSPDPSLTAEKVLNEIKSNAVTFVVAEHTS